MLVDELPKGIFEKFNIDGRYVGSERLTGGHINRSFRVDSDVDGTLRSFVFQRINRVVFPKPDQVMANIDRVTRHLSALRPANPWKSHTLTVVPTRSGSSHYIDSEGEFWRAYYYVEDCVTFDFVQSPPHAQEAGGAFGAFVAQMVDFPADTLHETIPDFHHTPTRLNQLMGAIQSDGASRVASCHQEIEFATTRAHLAHALIGVFSEDPSAQRVTHNDCKINNVLFHEASGKAACVIDLDTVMPGTALYDFGDLVRTVCGTAKEDERDLDRMTFSMDNFRAVLNGYLQPLRTILTPAERRRFALAGKVITYEIGLRFLADHLNGDLYFSVSREQHNLDRARTQFKLVSEMERRWDEIRHAAEEETGEVQLG